MLLKIQIDNSKAKENHLSINRILEGDSSSSFSGNVQRSTFDNMCFNFSSLF